MYEHWATIKCSGVVFSAKTELLESFDQVSQAWKTGEEVCRGISSDALDL